MTTTEPAPAPQVGAAPRATPPVVIGPFPNVPAPGSPIRSDWPQQITHYVVDRGVGTWLYNVTVNEASAIRVEAGTAIYTLSGLGVATITYPVPFAAGGVAVSVQAGDIQLGPLVITVDYNMTTISGNDVQIRVRNPVLAGCPDHANQTVRVVWMAIGKAR